MKDPTLENRITISDEDITILESLVKSPAFSALRRVLDRYRDECQSSLLAATEPHRVYQIQGRLIGIRVIEALPGLLVKQREHRLEREKADRERLVPGKSFTTPNRS